MLAAVALVHIFSYLHREGSSNPFPLETRKVYKHYISFYPYFFVKDLVFLLLFLGALMYFIAFAPNALGHSDNYIPANNLVTPVSSVTINLFSNSGFFKLSFLK